MRQSFFILSLLVSTGALLLVLNSCNTRNQEPAQAIAPAAPPAAYPAGEASPRSASSALTPPAHGGTSSRVKTTYSGLQYEILKEGTGQRPTSFNKVKVHYHGTLPDGTVFDSSVQRGTPSIFPLNRVIPGWIEGIQLMREGAKYRFTIPAELGYGARGNPPKIGPNQILKFDVELFEVLY